jgi:hypothetical protein
MMAPKNKAEKMTPEQLEVYRRERDAAAMAFVASRMTRPKILQVENVRGYHPHDYVRGKR